MATVFGDRPKGTERPKQINARRGVNHLPAETISNQRRLIRGKLAPRKVRETPLLTPLL